jgi:hypothetical protein
MFICMFPCIQTEIPGICPTRSHVSISGSTIQLKCGSPGLPQTGPHSNGLPPHAGGLCSPVSGRLDSSSSRSMSTALPSVSGPIDLSHGRFQGEVETTANSRHTVPRHSTGVMLFLPRIALPGTVHLARQFSQNTGHRPFGTGRWLPSWGR